MIDPAYVQRHGELCITPSEELGRMLRARGYRLRGRDRKQDRVYALLFLEQWPVVMDVINQIGVEPLDGQKLETGVAAASEG